MSRKTHEFDNSFKEDNRSKENIKSNRLPKPAVNQFHDKYHILRKFPSSRNLAIASSSSLAGSNSIPRPLSMSVLDYDSIIQYDDTNDIDDEYEEFEINDGGARGDMNRDINNIIDNGNGNVNRSDEQNVNTEKIVNSKQELENENQSPMINQHYSNDSQYDTDDPFTSNHPTALVVDDYEDIDDINSYYSATSSTKSFSPIVENIKSSSSYRQSSILVSPPAIPPQISPSRTRALSRTSQTLSGSGSTLSASLHYNNLSSGDRRSQVFEELDAVHQRIRKLRFENERMDGRNTTVSNSEASQQEETQSQEKHVNTQAEIQHQPRAPPQLPQLTIDDNTHITTATSTYPQLEPLNKLDQSLEWDNQEPISGISSSPPRPERRSVSLQGPYFQAENKFTPERERVMSGNSRERSNNNSSQRQHQHHQRQQQQQQPQPQSPSERHVLNLLDRAKRLRSNDPMISMFEKVVDDTMNVYTLSENYDQTSAIDQVYLSLSEFLLSYCDLVPDIGDMGVGTIPATGAATPTPNVTNGRSNSLVPSRYSYINKHRVLPSQYHSSPLAYENGSVYDANTTMSSVSTRFREPIIKSSPLTRTQSAMGGFQRPLNNRRRSGGTIGVASGAGQSNGPYNPPHHRFSGDFSRYDNYF